MRSGVHIYCGDGKGKTTAATGLAVRAAGNGMRVLFARFLKNERSSELSVLDEIPGIEVIHLTKSFGFYNRLSEQEKQEQSEYYRSLWQTITAKAASGCYDMLVMDEIMAAVSLGIISASDVVDLLDSRPAELEVVMTGRDPDEALIERADYVSEIRKIKHPYDKGVAARKGIEY